MPRVAAAADPVNPSLVLEMSTITENLLLAESIADRYGDIQQFRLDYEKLRESHPIQQSIELALGCQEILEFFQAHLIDTRQFYLAPGSG